jgi:hypothetical protein
MFEIGAQEFKWAALGAAFFFAGIAGDFAQAIQ